jgi:hypothetical protein
MASPMREMDEFVDSCMHKWDSLKARKCRGPRYNDNKIKVPVVSARQKRTRQEIIEQSSFTVVAEIKEKEKVADEEDVEGDDPEGKPNANTPEIVPAKLKQATLGNFLIKRLNLQLLRKRL